MRVRDIMTPQPIGVGPDTPVLDARQLMTTHHFRHLLVMDSGRLAGIVTDRDIRLSMPSQATSLSVWELTYLLAKMTVDAIMTRGVIVIGPERDAADVAQLMLDHKIGAVPVVDGGRVTGIVTETDVLRAFVGRARADVPHPSLR